MQSSLKKPLPQSFSKPSRTSSREQKMKKSASAAKVLVCYIPVLHDGYLQLFKKHPDARRLYIFGHDVIAEFSHLDRDIRRIEPEFVKKAVEAWNIFESVEILT